MSLEINEIGIRMRVRDGTTGPGEGGASEGTCGPEEQGRGAGGRDDLVEECVRRVLRAMKTLQER